MLDRVIEDRIIDDGEIAELSALAAELGLTQDGAIQAHRDYLLHLATAAWRDRVVTDSGTPISWRSRSSSASRQTRR